MLGRIFLVFLAITGLELWLLVKITAATSIWFTLLTGLFTLSLGLSLLRGVGARAAMRLQQSAASGKPPDRVMAEGLLYVIAGAFLILPGFLTDIVGALIVLPPLRHILSKRLLKSLPVSGFQGIPGMGMGGAGRGGFGTGAPFTQATDEPEAPGTDPSAGAFEGGHFNASKVKYTDGYVPPKPSTGPVILDAEVVDDGPRR